MFITFEGGEGTGKTTQINILKKYLEDQGLEVVITREPGGVVSAENIRAVIFDNEIDPITETMLYAAARREHYIKKIKPALDAGKIVICDRFIDSSIVYQGIVRGVGVDLVENINKYAINNVEPDLTIFFDLDPETGLKRVSLRNEQMNRFDKESLDFHLKVRKGYNLLSKTRNRFVLIDASKSIEDVTKQIINIMKISGVVK